MRDMVLVVIGPSCSGKDTLVDKTVELAVPGAMRRVVRTTTRPPRRGERNGERYEFISKERFRTIEKAGGFLETSSYRGWRYGTRIDAFQPGIINILPLDLKSLKQLKENGKGIAIRVAYVDASLGTRLKRYEDREGHKSFEMYRRAIADSIQYRHAISDLLRMGTPHTYLPGEFGLLRRTDQMTRFCRDWVRGSED